MAAGVSLLERSLLVEWSKFDSAFSPPVPEVAFEFASKRIDEVFGRLICWITFSAGAELLAKGVLLLNEIEIRKTQNVPRYPDSGENLASWAERFVKDSKSGGLADVTHFGTLGNLIGDSSNVDYPLRQLCAKVQASQTDQNLLLAAYLLLAKSIRNRDAHAFVPKVRGEHFWLVPELFVKSFNLLVSWIPGGASQLN